VPGEPKIGATQLVVPLYVPNALNAVSAGGIEDQPLTLLSGSGATRARVLAAPADASGQQQHESAVCRRLIRHSCHREWQLLAPMGRKPITEDLDHRLLFSRFPL